ncbi:hypothetical protein DL95DRAFT_472591 [Leptodontidium sp. 2 PMI_412]|nr:hypothetical protein DL95DRAFT_472591 [Leptodontidium sp. 2 PMI_412]
MVTLTINIRMGLITTSLLASLLSKGTLDLGTTAFLTYGCGERFTKADYTQTKPEHHCVCTTFDKAQTVDQS